MSHEKKQHTLFFLIRSLFRISLFTHYFSLFTLFSSELLGIVLVKVLVYTKYSYRPGLPPTLEDSRLSQ